MQSATDPYATTTSTTASTGVAGVVLLFDLAILVISVASMWRIFSKAGKPGWAAIVPFYNLYVMLQIAERPAWWMLLFFIPLVNIVFAFIVSVDIGKAFGKSTGWSILMLIILGIIGYPMLAFGSAQYVGKGGGAPSDPGSPVAPNPVPPMTPPSVPPSTPPAATPPAPGV